MDVETTSAINPITTFLFALCIYLAFRFQDDIAIILGFRDDDGALSQNNERNEQIPVILSDALESSDCVRVNNLILSFSKAFDGEQLSFIIRAPGIVNLFGSFTEFCGYPMLSMAVEKNLLFAVQIVNGINSKNILQLCTTKNGKMKSIQIDLKKKGDDHWSNHFVFAFDAISNFLPLSSSKCLRIMIDENISFDSSASFVCGAAVCLLFANLSRSDFNKLSKTQIASLLDSKVCVMGSENLKLPSHLNASWIVSNALAQTEDEIECKLKVREIECRFAALILAKSMNLRQWRQVLTLRDVQSLSRLQLDDLMFYAMDLLNSASYSIEQIEDELDCKAKNIKLEALLVGIENAQNILANLKKIETKLALQKRALHVFGEANRAKMFRQLCSSEIEDVSIDKLGRLMNDSHLSLRDKFECSCDQIDELQSLCIEGGAIGSRLAGNGCVVSLVQSDKVKEFQAYLNKNYYASIPKIPLNHQFATSASNGLTVVQIEHADSS